MRPLRTRRVHPLNACQTFALISVMFTGHAACGAVDRHNGGSQPTRLGQLQDISIHLGGRERLLRPLLCLARGHGRSYRRGSRLALGARGPAQGDGTATWHEIPVVAPPSQHAGSGLPTGCGCVQSGSGARVTRSPPRARATRRRHRISSNSAGALRALLDGAGFEWAVPHTFPRSVATRLSNAGVPIARIADQLGHADPAMTASDYLRRDFEGDKSDLAQHL